RTALAAIGAGVSATVAASMASKARAATPSVWPDGSAPVRANDLADGTAGQPRWISQSGSRIVVNPYDVLATNSPVQQSNRPDVPLNVAYYSHDEATRLDDLLMLDVRPPGDAPGYAAAEVGFDDACTQTANWTATGSLTMTIAGSVLTLAATDASPDTYA